MSINKKAFSDRMAEKGGITKKQALKDIDLFFETLLDCLSEGEKVKFVRYGSFELRTTKERVGINPKTWDRCIIPEHKRIKFRASEDLIERIK